MKIRYLPAVALGKAARYVSRLSGHGGSALPGLVIERLFPGFIIDVLKSLPNGVVVVTGTNGKTTTTKIITELLESQGLRVLTNSTGSNFMRGVISATLNSYKGISLPKDIAVLELDEAYGARFVMQVKPDYVVALNVMRDQLDRFGELSKTKRLIATILNEAEKAVVINGDEPSLVEVGDDLKVKVAFYGASSKIRHVFPTDAELLMSEESKANLARPKLAVELEDFKDQDVNYRINDQVYARTLTIKGQYNFHNSAAALALVNLVMPKVNTETWLDQLTLIKPAFGRGELININGDQLEILLVKNPSSFRQAIYSQQHKATTMIAINDNYADGRDVSWLWDVDFTKLNSDISIVSGKRATDMALRLYYDGIKTEQVEHDLTKALDSLINAKSGGLKRIFCTYTAMLALRARLSEITTIEESGL